MNKKIKKSNKRKKLAIIISIGIISLILIGLGLGFGLNWNNKKYLEKTYTAIELPAKTKFTGDENSTLPVLFFDINNETPTIYYYLDRFIGIKFTMFLENDKLKIDYLEAKKWLTEDNFVDFDNLKYSSKSEIDNSILDLKWNLEFWFE